MHADGKLIYRCMQMEKHVAIYTMHKSYMCIWIKSHDRNSGVISLNYYCRKLMFTWMHYRWICRCTWTRHPDGYWGRQTCLGTWIDVHYGCSTDGHIDACRFCLFFGYCLLWMLSRQTCLCTWTLLTFNCSLWMPQQTDMLLHTGHC